MDTGPVTILFSDIRVSFILPEASNATVQVSGWVWKNKKNKQEAWWPNQFQFIIKKIINIYQEWGQKET